MIAGPTLLVAAGRGMSHAAEPVIPWLRIVVAFLLCIALAVAAIMLLRRYQGGRADLRTMLGAFARAPDGVRTRALRLEDRIRLTATSQVVVLRWGDVQYLVHVGTSGARLLDRRAVQAEDGA